MVPEKVPRRRCCCCKSKTMSNSGAEDVQIRKSSRKLPQWTASAAAKRLLNVYQEDDPALSSDSEKELEGVIAKWLLRRFRFRDEKAQQ